MIFAGKTKHKYLKLIIASAIFLILTIGAIISPFIMNAFYIILIIFLPFVLAYICYYLLIPYYRVEIKDDSFILHWVRHLGKFKIKVTIPLNEFVGCFDSGKNGQIIILATSGEYLIKNIEDVQNVIDELKPYYPENAKVNEYAESFNFDKLDQYEGIFYCQFLHVALSKLVKFVKLDDELFDLYLYIKFYNEFIKGRLLPFAVYNRAYLDRLIKFMNKIELNWIPVYIDNIFKAFPKCDENYLDNFYEMFINVDEFKEFNAQTIKNAKLVLKINEENDNLMINQLLKYCHSLDLKARLNKALEEINA